MKTDQEMITLEVETTSDTFRITIPSVWRVTFSNFNPGSKYGGEGNALRVYESETKQRACFRNVISFRDMSIEMERKIVSKAGVATWSNDEKGNSKMSNENISETWKKV